MNLAVSDLPIIRLPIFYDLLNIKFKFPSVSGEYLYDINNVSVVLNLVDSNLPVKGYSKDKYILIVAPVTTSHITLRSVILHELVHTLRFDNNRAYYISNISDITIDDEIKYITNYNERPAWGLQIAVELIDNGYNYSYFKSLVEKYFNILLTNNFNRLQSFVCRDNITNKDMKATIYLAYLYSIQLFYNEELDTSLNDFNILLKWVKKIINSNDENNSIKYSTPVK